jgi:CheY-like chemotaxis protein
MDLKTLTILVVDDRIDNVRVLSEMLEHYGCEVLIATDGRTSLGIAAKAKPSGIFLDISMPLMDGFEVCRQLKGNPETAGIPVYFLSGHDSPEIQNSPAAALAAGYILKPFRWDDIRAALDKLSKDR